MHGTIASLACKIGIATPVIDEMIWLVKQAEKVCKGSPWLQASDVRSRCGFHQDTRGASFQNNILYSF
jgi:hypothetical protein